MKPSEAALKAADLIEPDGAWTQDVLARDSNGECHPNPHSEAAVSFCMAGSLYRAAGIQNYDAVKKASLVLMSILGDDTSLGGYNDVEGRTQQECVDLLRRVGKELQEEGK